MEGTPLQTVEGQKLENHCQTGGNTSSDGLWKPGISKTLRMAGLVEQMNDTGYGFCRF